MDARIVAIRPPHGIKDVRRLCIDSSKKKKKKERTELQNPDHRAPPERHAFDHRARPKRHAFDHRAISDACGMERMGPFGTKKCTNM
jgi:hypothetical protein